MLDSIPNDSADETSATETAPETSEPHARRGIVRDSKRSYAQLLDFVRRNPFSDFCPTGESISLVLYLLIRVLYRYYYSMSSPAPMTCVRWRDEAVCGRVPRHSGEDASGHAERGAYRTEALYHEVAHWLDVLDGQRIGRGASDLRADRLRLRTVAALLPAVEHSARAAHSVAARTREQHRVLHVGLRAPRPRRRKRKRHRRRKKRQWRD